MPSHRLLAAALPALVLALAPCAAAAPALDDGELDALLDAHAHGIIYLWSPHMPYSVRGAGEALALSRALGTHLTLLLDPQAEPALAARERTRAALPPQAMRRAGAQALYARGATLHFPTVLVFRDGHLDRQMLPGYTPPAALSAFVRQRLGR